MRMNRFWDNKWIFRRALTAQISTKKTRFQSMKMTLYLKHLMTNWKSVCENPLEMFLFSALTLLTTKQKMLHHSNLCNTSSYLYTIWNQCHFFLSSSSFIICVTSCGALFVSFLNNDAIHYNLISMYRNCDHSHGDSSSISSCNWKNKKWITYIEYMNCVLALPLIWLITLQLNDALQ